MSEQKRNASSLNRQRGVILVMGLIMLVVMTLIAVVAIKLTSSSIQVVGNSQFRQEAVSAGQKAIETVISSPITSSTPEVQNIDVNGDGVSDFTVTFRPMVCKSYRAVDTTVAGLPKECYGSKTLGSLCYWTLWDVQADVTDVGGLGVAVSIHQGIRTISGADSVLAACS